MTGVSPHKEAVMPSFGVVFAVNLKQQADELTVDLLVIWDVKFLRSCDVTVVIALKYMRGSMSLGALFDLRSRNCWTNSRVGDCLRRHNDTWGHNKFSLTFWAVGILYS